MSKFHTIRTLESKRRWKLYQIAKDLTTWSNYAKDSAEKFTKDLHVFDFKSTEVSKVLSTLERVQKEMDNLRRIARQLPESQI